MVRITIGSAKEWERAAMDCAWRVYAPTSCRGFDGPVKIRSNVNQPDKGCVAILDFSGRPLTTTDRKARICPLPTYSRRVSWAGLCWPWYVDSAYRGFFMR